jgi:hypothetical protein
MLTSRIHKCKPDANKKAPTDWRTLANGGIKPGRASGWNPAEGHRSYISTSGLVSVNPKTTILLIAVGNQGESERIAS